MPSPQPASLTNLGYNKMEDGLIMGSKPQLDSMIPKFSQVDSLFGTGNNNAARTNSVYRLMIAARNGGGLSPAKKMSSIMPSASAFNDITPHSRDCSSNNIYNNNIN